MDTSTSATNGTLNGGGQPMTRAALREARKAEKASKTGGATPAAATRKAAPKKTRAKRGTGKQAQAAAARKAEEIALRRTGTAPPIAETLAGDDPVCIELSATLRSARKSPEWTRDRIENFTAATKRSLLSACGFGPGPLAKAA